MATVFQLVVGARLEAQAALLRELNRHVAGCPARDFEMVQQQKIIRAGKARLLVGGPR